MALFNKEPEKGPKVQPAQPAATPYIVPQPSSAATSASASTTVSPARPQLSPQAPAEGRSHLDRGTKISGKLTFDGPARIDGEVDGEIIAKDTLSISESAVVTAQIKTGSIVVAGKVSGDIVSSQRIEIGPLAKVIGNLTAPVLVVHEGALFEGHCSMHPEGAREDHKVTVFPKEERVAAKEERVAPKEERDAQTPATASVFPKEEHVSQAVAAGGPKKV